MSKTEATRAIGKQPDNIIAAKKFEHGIVEVVQYTRYDMGITILEQYWLYFLNDSLEQWGRPGDWNEEADRIYEIRFKND